jgi:hypothetical protein
MSPGKLAVWGLLESHLPFLDAYGLNNVHYALHAEIDAIFREKITQLQK